MKKILPALLGLLLVGCGYSVVTPKIVGIAEEKCRTNEGVSAIKAYPSGRSDVVCANGAYFTYIND